MFDIDTDTSFQTMHFQGDQLEWCGEPYDNDFGIQVRLDARTHDAMDVDAFFADYVRNPPEGTVYFDGFIICFSFADMKDVMETLQERYDYICHTEEG